MLLKIAFRNILRNGRRSLMTCGAIAVSAIAMILFGEYQQFITLGIETGVVARMGHLTIFHAGYFDFGAGNPNGYSISGYEKVMDLLKNDPVLKPMLRVVTPQVSIFGIAGSAESDTSKTFMGMGVVPSEREAMIHWDDYHFYDDLPGSVPRQFHFGLHDGQMDKGIIGAGMARSLGLCKHFRRGDCGKNATDGSLKALPGREPQLNLLAASVGTPNIVRLNVVELHQQGFKEIDDMYVGMNIALAQQLLYGRDEHKAVSILVQLQHTADLNKARNRLNVLFAQHHLDLEVRDFTEVQPAYNQITGLFDALFAFIAAILAVIVLFTVVNTMTMSVMERTNEIGTMRAMGVRRSGVRRQFVIEGLLLGVIGATGGVILGTLGGFWFNHLGLTWHPPGQAADVPLLLRTTGVLALQLSIFGALTAMAALAAIIPANRAARMMVVDALRHV